MPFFEDGAEPAQYEGYAAIGDEILDQLDEPPAAVVVPVGNGALLGGIGRAILGPLARDAPRRRRRGGGARDGRQLGGGTSRRRASESATFADGLAVRVAIPYAVDVLNEVATHMLRRDARPRSPEAFSPTPTPGSASRARPAQRSPPCRSCPSSTARSS